VDEGEHVVCWGGEKEFEHREVIHQGAVGGQVIRVRKQLLNVEDVSALKELGQSLASRCWRGKRFQVDCRYFVNDWGERLTLGGRERRIVEVDVFISRLEMLEERVTP
jgi:hypothetical protein